MNKLYATSGITVIIFTIVMLVMSMIKAPLGGEPYAVVQLEGREKAQELLKKSIASRKQVRRKKTTRTSRKNQKVPVYFGKNNKDTNEPENKMEKTANNEIGRKSNSKDKTEFNHRSEITSKLHANELEYIAKIGLPPAPDPKLIEKSSFGMLPRISDEGKRPQDIYARPSPHIPGKNKTKTIAILLTGLGLSQPTTESAIEKLPPEITFAFNPYARNLKGWSRRTRSSGHEFLLEVPMEPFDYPDNDPGPHTLLSQQSDTVNIKRLKWLMARMTGYTGIVNREGGRFTSEEAPMFPILRELKNRGLFYMDSNPQSADTTYHIASDLQLDYLQGSIIVDEVITPTAIDIALKKLETLANKNGSAIGIASAIPLSIQRLSEWSRKLKKRGIILTPLSASINKNQS